MKVILLFTSLIISIAAFGQFDSTKTSNSVNEVPSTNKDSTECMPHYDSLLQREVYLITDQMPSFPGGMDLLFNYIAKNLKYPPITIEGSIQGRVYIRFIIEPNGKITNIKVLRGIDPFLDKNAIEVIQNMPDWIPGQCNGKKVPAYFTIPITFKLN